MKATVKGQLHPRNPHRFAYDFPALIKVCPDLGPYIHPGRNSQPGIDFSDPIAVKTLNRALLMAFYGIVWWDIPPASLCPPVPGRADMIHYLADLLAGKPGSAIPKGPAIRVLDIGVGANCIYPIIGHRSYGWHFVASDINRASLEAAGKIRERNPLLREGLELRYQPNPIDVFRGIIREGEFYDLTICNPPFHASAGMAQESNQKRLNKMGLVAKPEAALNFGGQDTELWCPGGELAFLKQMITQSADFKRQVTWFTSLVSKKENLVMLYKALRQVKVSDLRTIPMAQGQKISRFIAWTYQKPV